MAESAGRNWGVEASVGDGVRFRVNGGEHEGTVIGYVRWDGMDLYRVMSEGVMYGVYPQDVIYVDGPDGSEVLC